MTEPEVVSARGVSNPTTGATPSSSVEFRKLDILVRDSEYVAGEDNVTTIMVRNTYPHPIRLGTVRARHSSLVIGSDEIESQDAKSRAPAGYTRFNFRLPSFFPFSISSKSPVVEFRYTKNPIESEPIIINASQGSTIDVDSAASIDRRLEINAGEGAKVTFRRPERRLNATSDPARQSEISSTSEIITGFTWGTNSWLLFIPSRVGIDIEVPYEVNGEFRSQVISAVFEIKPPIHSIIVGGIIGSLVGSAARFLTEGRATFDIQFAIKLIGSALLATMASVALSRKSGSQAFITVEDFFGSFGFFFKVWFSDATESASAGLVLASKC